MTWSMIGFGKHKGKTLPQVMFADPDWFFWAMENNAFAGNSTLRMEAEKINRMARRIKVKERGGEKMVVEHYVHPPTKKYSHFDVIPASQESHAGASPAFREDVIDMSAPRRFAPYDKTGFKNLIAALKLHSFGSKSARMTKERCEDFFSTASNFSL